MLAQEVSLLRGLSLVRDGLLTPLVDNIFFPPPEYDNEQHYQPLFSQ